MSTNYITQITDTGGTTHDIAEGVDTRIFRATCSTAAATTEKVATLDDSTNFSLVAGVKVAVTFTYGNSAATPTLRVDGTTTGTAKTIAIPSSVTAYTTGDGTTYNTWGAYETVLFTYTGTYWVHDTSGYLGYLAYNTANGRQAKITASGILKGDGSGGVTAATAGTDYQAPLPSQSGNSGKYLTTDGSAVSWATVDLSSKANIASPTFTGTPAAPTASAGTNTTQLATTAFVNTALDNKITYGTTDLTAGTSSLTTGVIYLVYE